VLKVKSTSDIFDSLFLMYLVKISAKYCPIPPDPPFEVKVTVTDSGLYFGAVCPGSDGFDSLPLIGCENHNIKIAFMITSTLGCITTTKYKLIIDKDTGGSMIALLIFSNPINPSDIVFSGFVSFYYTYKYYFNITFIPICMYVCMYR
jgi:hypothetical protein